MVRHGREIALAVVLALPLLVAAGCGGGNGSTSSQTSTGTVKKTSLTKKEWVDKANEICGPIIDRRTHGMEAFYKAHGVHGNPNLHQREAANTAVVVPNAKERVEALEALPVSPREAAKVHAFLRALEEGAREAKSHPYNLAKPEAPIPFHRSAKLGTELGLLFCGEP
jgi:hypothetical protein